MSSELWEEMMNKEKAKFKNIEKHYAKLMEDRRVRRYITSQGVGIVYVVKKGVGIEPGGGGGKLDLGGALYL